MYNILVLCFQGSMREIPSAMRIYNLAGKRKSRHNKLNNNKKKHLPNEQSSKQMQKKFSSKYRGENQDLKLDI